MQVLFVDAYAAGADINLEGSCSHLIGTFWYEECQYCRAFSWSNCEDYGFFSDKNLVSLRLLSHNCY